MIKAGRKMIEIKIIPIKKQGKKVSNHYLKNYIKSLRLCLFPIILIFDFSISNSAAFGLKL